MKERVIIIGGGIIGILTAYFLQLKGKEVTVVERRKGIGKGASFANGSQLSFSHIFPYIFYKKSSRFPQFFQRKETGVYINKKNTLAQDFLSRQKIEHLQRETAFNKLISLAKGSAHAFDKIFKAEEMDRYIKPCGIIHLFRTEQEFLAAVEIANKTGQEFSILKRERLLDEESGIRSLNFKVNAGLYFKNDRTSNCYDICKILEAKLTEKGVKFLLEEETVRFKTYNNRVVSIITASGGQFEADNFIIAAGEHSRFLGSLLDIELDIFSVRGYSCTFNMQNNGYAPQIGLIDSKKRMVYSSYKDYLRIAGFFDIELEKEKCGFRMTRFKEEIFKSFPFLAKMPLAHEWTENRPFTPSSVPIIQKLNEFSNLFINSGHGALGFTLSAISGKKVSELLE